MSVGNISQSLGSKLKFSQLLVEFYLLIFYLFWFEKKGKFSCELFCEQNLDLNEKLEA